MTNQTIVAVYDTPGRAAEAVRDLEAAGVPASAIRQHAGRREAAHEKGLWSNLFGGDPEALHDTAVYDRSLANGSTIVTVSAPDQYLHRTAEILERHDPVDIDDRAAGYAAAPAMAGPETAPLAAGETAPGARAGSETVSLSEGQIGTGKRAINLGTTRVRRYAVEGPQQAADAPAGRHPGTGFADRVVEVTESVEDAIVSSTDLVREKVGIGKGSGTAKRDAPERRAAGTGAPRPPT